jgi:hypothetical protein
MGSLHFHKEAPDAQAGRRLFLSQTTDMMVTAPAKPYQAIAYCTLSLWRGDDCCELEQYWHCKAGAQPAARGRHGGSPPVKRPSAALLWYCNAISSPFIGRSGTSVVSKISGPHSSACTQYGGA